LAATRRTLPVTVYLAYSLRNLGIRCELIDQGGGLVQEQVKLMSKRDVLLAVSFSPYAPVTLESATLAHGRGIGVIGITDAPSSPLARIAEVCLEVVEADHGGFRSLCGAVTLALTLAVSIARRRSEPA
jgi:DNA-binding MurR/RpiR family transcriptional regulator